MVQTRNSTKSSDVASHKVRASRSRPMPASDKSANGTSRSHHRSRMESTVRVAGTGHPLTGSDAENTQSAPPEQGQRPRVLQEPNKRRKWTRNENTEVMYCYYKATIENRKGYVNKIKGM